MALWHVLVVLVAVFIMGFFGSKAVISFNDKRQSSDATNLDLSIGFVLLISILLSACFFSSTLPPSLIFCYYAVLAMGLVCLVFVDTRFNFIKYLFGLIGICFLSTYFLPSTLFPDSVFLGLLNHLGLAVLWTLFMWIFAKMDRVPFFSMTFSTSIALCVFLLSGFFTALPAAFGYLALSILIAQMGINMYLKRNFVPRLGTPGSALVGYLWGFFAVYLLALGHTASVVILYAYPTMEIILAGGVSYGLYRHFSLQAPYLVERALAKNILPTKVLQSVMMWGILLATLAALSVVSAEGTGPSVYYIALGIILINIYIRLSGWGIPRPRLRDVGKDLKEGFKEVKKELSTLPLKKDNQPVAKQATPKTKKTTVSKKAPPKSAKGKKGK